MTVPTQSKILGRAPLEEVPKNSLYFDKMAMEGRSEPYAGITSMLVHSAEDKYERDRLPQRDPNDMGLPVNYEPYGTQKLLMDELDKLMDRVEEELRQYDMKHRKVPTRKGGR